ncbi:MAG: DNA repair protein RecO [Bacilli bacterium]|nr:DNA repair protein RecO [Bacilli bacterium]
MANLETVKKIGIVLHKTPVKEADAMVNCLGPDGRFSFYARGVRKAKSKNAFSLSELTLGEFACVSSTGGLLTLKEAYGNRNFLKDDDFDAIAVENFLCELSSHIFFEEEGEGASYYPYLLEALEAIKEGFDPLSIAFLCLAIALREVGYGLEVNCCVRCKSREHITAISFSDGGFICLSCYGQGEDSAEDEYLLRMYRYAFRLPLGLMRKNSFRKEFALAGLIELEKYFADCFGYHLNSLRFLIENC